MPTKTKPEIDQIAQVTANLLEHRFQALESRFDALEDRFESVETLISECASTKDLSRAKTNVLLNLYKADSCEQYTRRNNLRIHKFTPSDERDLTDSVVELLNHMVSIKSANQAADVVNSQTDLFSSQCFLAFFE